MSLVLVSSLFVSCTGDPLSMRAVEVVLPEKHRWEEMQNQSLWYTLVWTERGSLKRCHLKAGEKRTTLWVRRGETVVFCAFPLGIFSPAGGAVLPGGEPLVLLTEQEGVLCRLLQESTTLNSDALGCLAYPQLLREALAKGDDLTLLDANRLQKDLVNGDLSSSSIHMSEPLSVVITIIPQGYWVGERSLDPSFWSYWGAEGIPLALGEGLHCFWNREDSLLLRIFVDLKEEASFVSIQKGPLW